VGLWDGIQILDPCAGIGHLVHCLSSVAGPVYLNVTAYEIADLPYRIGARLFSWVDWRHTNVFYHAADLAGRFDLVMCHPPCRGSARLGLQDISGWHTGPTQTEYLFLELAARALKPGGRAVFIAPAHFAEAMPAELKAYLEGAGFGLTGRSEEPLPGDFTEPKAPDTGPAVPVSPGPRTGDLPDPVPVSGIGTGRGGIGTGAGEQAGVHMHAFYWHKAGR
jgi:hypothetical protein